ncbi:hypothetical protein AVEN_153406-1 [Araneus ventricosus]|uniref:Uncharacterized protein n=1 Tax=Araneus ventricosus TaxID=182803 RepID=A0A4Y2E7S6_ARAVE|nr:hypothetical protein AVEN_153406-1 [Araneus ventricosus]
MNGVNPVLPKHPGTLNDNRCNRSSIEARVLVPITGHGPTHAEGDTSYYHWKVILTSTIIVPLGEARTRLLFLAASHPLTRGATSGERWSDDKDDP